MSKYNINTNVNCNDESNVDSDVKLNDNETLILKKHDKKSSKLKPVQFYLQDNLISKIDLLCKQTGQKRSELAAELLNYAISRTKVVE